MILTVEEMQAAERAALDSGVTAESLMEVAGAGLADIVCGVFPGGGRCEAAYGKGHNGGDVLVAGRILRERGWHVVGHGTDQEPAPLTARKLGQFRATPNPPPCGGSLVILDGLLGVGATGAPREPVAAAIRAINRQRGAWVLSADIPSGLDADTGEAPGECVVANRTAAIAFVKSGLVADAASDVVGRIDVVPLPGLLAQARDDWSMTGPAFVHATLPPRTSDVHKGLCGRVVIVAGSVGFPGAARLASAAAVRGGAGLVTLIAEPALSAILSTSCIPEVMVRETPDLREVLDLPMDVLAIGPGLGRDRDSEVLTLLRESPVPTVVDADALNALAGNLQILCDARGPRLLTPHPGEMARLSPQNGRTRRAWAQDFVNEFPATLLLKGARTVIATPGRPGFYNSTGNPGMATGGMGDTLTGVCAALIGQHPSRPLDELAAAAAWLCGAAADHAITRGPQSPESLTASDVRESLGAAFREAR